MRAIIFDLYETLITEFDAAWRTRPSIASRLGVDEQACNAVVAACWRRRMSGELPDFPHTLREICHTLGHTPDETLIAQLYQERLLDKAQPFARIDPSIVQMLERLRAVPFRLGLLSNAAPEDAAAWPGCQLAGLFDDVVFSCQVGLVKPEAAIYELACGRLGVTPAEAIFVGDGGSQELSGAAAVGLTPYWATWFLDRWPDGKRSAEARREAAQYPQMQSPIELIDVIQNQPFTLSSG